MQQQRLKEQLVPAEVGEELGAEIIAVQLLQRIIPSTSTHKKLKNTRNESLLSRSIIQHDIHLEMQPHTDNESTLNTLRIKGELEKWLSRPPLWNQAKNDDENDM